MAASKNSMGFWVLEVVACPYLGWDCYNCSRALSGSLPLHQFSPPPMREGYSIIPLDQERRGLLVGESPPSFDQQSKWKDRGWRSTSLLLDSLEEELSRKQSSMPPEWVRQELWGEDSSLNWLLTPSRRQVIVSLCVAYWKCRLSSYPMRLSK